MQRFLRWMEQEGLDLAVVSRPSNQYYLSGFKVFLYSRPLYYLVTPQRTVFIVPGLEEEHARRKQAADEIRVYYEHPVDEAARLTLHDHLRQAITDLLAGRAPGGRPPRVGIEASHLPTALTSLLPEPRETVDLGPWFTRQRMVKDAGELALIRDSAKLASIGVRESVAASKPGVTEPEFELVGSLAVLRAAAERWEGRQVKLLTVTASGAHRTHEPHAETMLRALEPRDTVIHRRQVGIDGYFAECERTYFLGDPSPDQRRLFQVAYEAQQRAIEAVRPGAPARVVDEAAREAGRRGGVAQYMVHRSGHGLGLEHHEPPFLTYDNDLPLEPGMVFSVEPGVYVPGIGGFRHSDSVLVTESGYEVLTEGPKRLEDVILRG
ncbi:MAG TPA: Xaa-Pro peptidase family protein [Bacillota bacterium]